jgi:DNA-binding CsgD family transcriptional regulator
MNIDCEAFEALLKLEDAIANGNLHRLWAENDNIPNCWEKLDCKKEICPAFGKEQIRCWTMNGTFCINNTRSEELLDKWNHCKECGVFLEATKTPELRLKEVVNNIVFSLKCFSPSSTDIFTIKQNSKEIKKHYALTTRESEILFYILDRYSRKDIAAKLSISSETVKMHFKNIYKKLGSHSPTDVFHVLSHFSNDVIRSKVH